MIEPAVDQRTDDAAVAEFVDRLLERMTLREKVGQMTQVTLGTVCASVGKDGGAPPLDQTAVREAIIEHGVGSMLNVHDRAIRPDAWRRLLTELQDVATTETRLGIPLLYGIDAIHGAGYTDGSVLFPQQLAIGASWNPENARAMARATARQILASGIPWNFAPVLDVARTPLWSRFFESFGEDVHLVTELGRASLVGVREVPGVAGCAKHYLGYSAPHTGRDRTTAWIPEHELRERHLPPFKAAVEAGVRTMMVNSGEINGLPVHASRSLLTRLLRDELGFDGLLVTDWEDVIKLHTVYRVAETLEDAVCLSVDAGIDMSMTPFDLAFPAMLERLVQAGRISESRIDASVRRILRLKHELGLFAQAVPESPEAVDGPDVQAESLRAAEQAIVLLENRSTTLPLSGDARIALVGPTADKSSALLGAWSRTWQGNDGDEVRDARNSIRAAFEQYFGERLVPAESGPDVLVVCVGADPTVEKPGDIDDLRLDAVSRNALEEAFATKLPVVLILTEDRPRLLGRYAEQAESVVWAGRLGPFGGEALARVMDGAISPSGRLPFTYPRAHAELIPYDHRKADQLGRNYGAVWPPAFDGFKPQWPLGTGLGYSTVEYFDIEAPTEVGPEATIEISVGVRNTGEHDVDHVVLLFVTDCFASLAPAVKRIRGFRRVHLLSGEAQRVHMEISPEALGFYAPGQWRLEAGSFVITLGTESAQFRLTNGIDNRLPDIDF